MKRKLCILLAVTMFTLLTVVPAMASEPPALQLNGELVTVSLQLENGNTVIGTDDYARLTGATVTMDTANNQMKIEQNGKSLVLTFGNTTASLDGESLVLPLAPEKAGNAAIIPLASVARAFGYDVQWVPEKWQVIMGQAQSENATANLTPTDILAKSNAASLAYNTYSMNGKMDMTMKITADGKDLDLGNMETTTDMKAQYRHDPMAIYVKQTIQKTPGSVEKSGALTMEDMAVETYMTDKNMYMNLPNVGWVKYDSPINEGLWKELQDVQSDPLKIVQQMKDFGIDVKFAEEQEINGKQYYVLKADMDPNKFMQSYKDLVSDMMPALDQEDENVDIEKMLDNMKMTFAYTAYINKETMISDKIDMDYTVDFDLPLDEIVDANTADTTELPQSIQMTMTGTGTFNITGLGDEFVEPDLSQAVDAKDLPEDAIQE